MNLVNRVIIVFLIFSGSLGQANPTGKPAEKSPTTRDQDVQVREKNDNEIEGKAHGVPEKELGDEDWMYRNPVGVNVVNAELNAEYAEKVLQHLMATAFGFDSNGLVEAELAETPCATVPSEEVFLTYDNFITSGTEVAVNAQYLGSEYPQELSLYDLSPPEEGADGSTTFFGLHAEGIADHSFNVVCPPKEVSTVCDVYMVGDPISFTMIYESRRRLGLVTANNTPKVSPMRLTLPILVMQVIVNALL